MAHQAGMIDPVLFEHLQAKIDEDTAFRDKIRDIVQELEKHTRVAQAKLSKVHSVQAIGQVNSSVSLDSICESVQKLSTTASTQPYYKWNNMWTRSMQDACFTILLYGWTSESGSSGHLMTINDVGAVMGIPVNLKDGDSFHLTIEEYLLALVSLIDELARLARNSVTLGDYRRPLIISQFIKDVHAGFQILNLKNDILRKRSDGIKYRVKEVEDVVYDLSLRDLIPKD